MQMSGRGICVKKSGTTEHEVSSLLCQFGMKEFFYNLMPKKALHF